jgi:hypothetical protein
MTVKASPSGENCDHTAAVADAASSCAAPAEATDKTMRNERIKYVVRAFMIDLPPA